MDDFDKKYLDYILEGRGKVNYLSFLITINLAVYVAVYITNDNMLFRADVRGVPVLLLILLSIINYLICLIYFREHNLDKRITKFIKEDYVEKNISDPKLKERIGNLARVEIRDKDRTWKTTRCLLALVNAIPFAMLIVMLVVWLASAVESCNLLENIAHKLITSHFFWLSSVIILIWFFIYCKFDFIFSLCFCNKDRKHLENKNWQEKSLCCCKFLAAIIAGLIGITLFLWRGKR